MNKGSKNILEFVVASVSVRNAASQSAIFDERSVDAPNEFRLGAGMGNANKLN